MCTSFLLMFVILFFTLTNHKPRVCRHHYIVVLFSFILFLSKSTPFEYPDRHSFSLFFYNRHFFHIHKYPFSKFLNFFTNTLQYIPLSIIPTYPFNTHKLMSIIDVLTVTHNVFVIFHINAMADVPSPP